MTHILQNNIKDSVLVFSRTKHGADKIARKLQASNISAEAIHGNKSQNARQNALNNFKSGRTRILVATDIAARGIDIDELKYVVNFELSDVAEKLTFTESEERDVQDPKEAQFHSLTD